MGHGLRRRCIGKKKWGAAARTTAVSLIAGRAGGSWRRYSYKAPRSARKRATYKAKSHQIINWRSRSGRTMRGYEASLNGTMAYGCNRSKRC